MISVYKTNDASVLAAITLYQSRINQMKEEGFAFRDSFGAKDAVFQYSTNGNKFGGLTFEPPNDVRFWTKPDRNNTQSPRSKVPKMTPEEKRQHTQLLQQWLDTFPNIRVKKDGVYESLGTDWGMVFLCGLVFFEHDGFVYIETGVGLVYPIIEIVGSEYQAAKSAYLVGAV